MAKKHQPDATNQTSEEPTVIVEMSFAEKYLPIIYSRHVQIGIYVVFFLSLIAGGSFWYLSSRLDAQNEAQQSTEAAAPPQEVVVTVVAAPANATIHIDGKAQGQNPVVLKLTASPAHHTIVARAPGHATLERDARFNRTQTIRLELPEIVAPEGDATDTPEEPAQGGAVQEVITD